MVAAVIVSAAVAAFKFKDILFALFDRSPDFTNRADIWAKVIDIASQTGSLKPGLAADILVVGGDPLRDLAALRDVRLVMQDGKIRSA